MLAKKLLLSIAALGVFFSVGTALVPASVYAQGSSIDCNTSGNLNENNCKIIGYIRSIIQALSALVGIVILTVVVAAGIQYTASKDNPQATAAAKTRLRDAVLAIVMYVFAFAFLQWIVPGGVVG